MNQRTEKAGRCPAVAAYVSPSVEVLSVCVERGYSSSYVMGSGGDSIVSEDYSWGTEIEL